MKDGKSVDSTLGFTALDGLCMGTRPGALDPGVVLYLFQNLGLSRQGSRDAPLQEVRPARHLRHQQRHARPARQAPSPEARLAVDYFVYRAAKEIGALAAVLGGIDGLVFTAGIGENSAEIRQRICEASAWLGIELDAEANAAHGPRISTCQQPGVGLGDPDQRGTDDRPAHGPAAGTGRRPAHERAAQ